MNSLKMESSSTRLQRADIVRTVAYVREMGLPDPMTDRLVELDVASASFDPIRDKQEVDQLAKSITVVDDVDKEVEINRLLTSDKPSMSMDEMIGIADAVEDDPADIDRYLD